jgi:AcrR family transcriptional regulator
VPRRAAALSRDEIVRVAIQVADAEGADAVTMRRIARELNAGTMSLPRTPRGRHRDQPITAAIATPIG